MRINRSNAFKLLIQGFFIGIVLVLGFNNNSPVDDQLRLISILSLVSLGMFIGWRYMPVVSISWFTILFLYLYNFGQVWLLLFGIELQSGSYKVTQFGNQQLYDAATFALVIINILQFALVLFDTQRKRVKQDYEIRYDLSNNGLKYTSRLVFVICFVMVTFNDLVQIITARTMGYVDSYTLGRDNAIIQTMIYIFPLIICLMLFQVKKRAKILIFAYAVIRCLIMMLLVGNRGQYISLLTVLMLFYLIELRDNSKIFSVKQYLFIALCGIGMFILAGYVANTRNVVGTHDSLSEVLFNNNIFTQMLNELGGTLINTEIAVGVIPSSIPFGKGISYLGAFIQLIPRMASFSPNLVQFNDLGSIFNGYFAKGYGLGGSYIAEMFFNFGWFSIFIQFLSGWILVKLDNILSKRNTTILKRSIIYYYTHAIFMYLRGNFSDFAVYTRILLYFLIVYLFIKTLTKRNKV